jgi:hypothetical protein
MTTKDNSTKAPRHNSSAPIWGIFLLFIGIVLLLQTFEVLPWGLWGTLWRFWPAIIIIIGLAILLRHTSIWLVSLLTVVILGGSIGFAVWQYQAHGSLTGNNSRTYSQPLGNISEANLNIDFTAGNLTVGSLPGSSANLMEAEVEARNDVSSLAMNFNQAGNQGYLSLNSTNQQYWWNGIKWNIDFTDKIPLAFDITSSAGSLDLNLSRMKVSGFNLELNAGSCDIKLPAPSGILTGIIKSNAASMNLQLPAGAAAKIHATTNIGSLDIDSRFTKNGSDYTTKNFEQAADRIELTIETNVGHVSIK